MRKIIIGYMFSLLTAGLFTMSIYTVFNHGITGVPLAIIQISVATLLAWMIGEMVCSYGEDEEDKK